MCDSRASAERRLANHGTARYSLLGSKGARILVVQTKEWDGQGWRSWRSRPRERRASHQALPPLCVCSPRCVKLASLITKAAAHGGATVGCARSSMCVNATAFPQCSSVRAPQHRTATPCTHRRLAAEPASRVRQRRSASYAGTFLRHTCAPSRAVCAAGVPPWRIRAARSEDTVAIGAVLAECNSRRARWTLMCALASLTPPC